VNFSRRLAQFVYGFLDIGKSPRLSDCIFVFAGKQERKIHGIKMWRFGYARRLILSVGRFEWRKFGDLGLDSDGGLEALVAQTPPEKRHFLVSIYRQQASCSLIRTGRLGTRSEARALAEYLRESSIRSLIVVSSPFHLRRASLSLRRALGKSDVRLTFIAVPEQMPPSCEVWSEFRKYLAYLLCNV